jgi:hypothetical protein
MNKTSFPQTAEQAGAGVKVLLLALAFLGLAAGGFWYGRHGATHNLDAADHAGLSDSTRAVLKNLDSPVEIHFYSLLDSASVSADTFAFADRINQLLEKYQQAGAGKVSVTRFNTPADANAAATEGLQPFNLDKGDACFLGLAVSCKGQKESFPLLSAEWEQALEFDLSRAIARLSAAQPTPNSSAKVPAGPAAPSAAAIEDLKNALTNLAAVSVTEGSQILRDGALQDYKTAAAEIEVQVQEARQRLADTQNGGSAADQQAAMKHFQQVQAEQADKLEQIAAKLHLRIATLEQIKKP